MTNGRAQLIGLGKCLNFIAKGGVSQSRLEERPHCWPLRAFYNLITLELSPERGQENRGVKKSGIVQTFAEANEMNPSQPGLLRESQALSVPVDTIPTYIYSIKRKNDVYQ